MSKQVLDLALKVSQNSGPITIDDLVKSIDEFGNLVQKSL